jgi:hypothetical protein
MEDTYATTMSIASNQALSKLGGKCVRQSMTYENGGGMDKYLENRVKFKA